MSETIISIQNVCKNYGPKEENKILKNISFDVHKEDFVTIMGPSGCGKSTLMYLIGGLDYVSSGKILVFNKDISTMKDSEKSAFRRTKTGFVFQFFNLVPNLTVEENILVPVIMDKQKPEKYKKRLEELLKITNLSEKRNYYPKELSGGQQQRVAVSRALIMNPPLLLADEPTGNLDSKNGNEVMKLFSTIHKEYGTTIVQVSHSTEMSMYGTRTIILCDGTVTSDFRNDINGRS